MPQQRTSLALYDILDAARDFQSILGDQTADDVTADRRTRYAIERCIEIISEASRRLPQQWKDEHSHIPWQDIAGIGSILRHNYDRVSVARLVELRGKLIDDLIAATLDLLERYDPEGRRFRDR